VLADSFILRAGAADFWVGSYFAGAAAIRERLEAFIVADDVVIEDCTADWVGVTLMESGAERVANAALLAVGGVEFSGRRGVAPTREWVFPRARANDVRAGLAGLREVEADEMEQRRIEARIPVVPRDIGPGDLPNEGGLDADAISYVKGCYLGQEVMARLKSMGQVRRRLLRVRGGGRKPVLPAELFQGERKVGELRTAVETDRGGNFIGLALVSLLNLRAELPLRFSADAGAGPVALIDTP
jgi:folate-binding protein YgfZ